MVILGMLWVFQPRMIAGQDKFGIGIIYGAQAQMLFNTNPWFLATFFTSLVSASKGIAEFLLQGPCRLLTKDGLFGGVGTFGFLLLTLNISLSIIGKLILLAVAYGGSSVDSIFDHKVSFFQ